MKSEANIRLFRPFGPAIAEIDMPDKLVSTLNNYIDDITKNEKKVEKLDVSGALVGSVHQELAIDKNNNTCYDFMKNFLESSIKFYIKSINKKDVKKINILNIWVVRQFKNEYNPNHYHSGHLSGVGYLTLPKNFGEHKNKKKTSTNGNIELIHGSRMFLAPSQFRIVPKVGKFYLFPHYLMHTVYPFNTEGERRSISFNAEVDSSIYASTYGRET